MSDYKFQSIQSVALPPSVRCLVGLFDSDQDAVWDAKLDEAVDDGNEHDDVQRFESNERIRFLAASYSVGSAAITSNQINLLTVSEPLAVDGGDVSDPSSSINDHHGGGNNFASIQVDKQSFAWSDGEIADLLAFPAKPDWFLTVESAVPPQRCHSHPGGSSAKIWLLPPPSTSSGDQEGNGNNDNGLTHVTSLPLDAYTDIRNSHTATANSTLNSSHHLVLLQAPSASESGDYREVSSIRLDLPDKVRKGSYNPVSYDRLTKLNGSSTTVTTSSSPPNATGSVNELRWSPHQHQPHQLGIAVDTGLLIYDLRCMEPSFYLDSPHWPRLRCLDFNPNRPDMLATGGDDGFVRLWDLRFVKSATSVSLHPVYAEQAHLHWVWRLRYHPTRDQLLLSAGSDFRLSLFNLASYSSDAFDVVARPPGCQANGSGCHDDKGLSSRAKSTALSEGLMIRIEEHEDSIYAFDWSPVDSWYFASISYDGNLLVHRVPDDVKFSILLQQDEDASLSSQESLT